MVHPKHLLNITRSTAYLVIGFMVIVAYMLLITQFRDPLDDHFEFFVLPLLVAAVFIPRWIMMAEYRFGLAKKPKRSDQATVLDGLLYVGDNFLRGVVSLGVVCMMWPFKLAREFFFLPGTIMRSIGKALLRFVNAGFVGVDTFTDVLVETDHQPAMLMSGIIWLFRAAMWVFSRFMFAPFYVSGYGLKWSGEFYIRLIKGINAGIREAMRNHPEEATPLTTKPKHSYPEQDEPIFYLGDDGEIYQQAR